MAGLIVVALTAFATTIGLVALTTAIPGGIDGNHYAEFLKEIYPVSLQQMSWATGNHSLIYLSYSVIFWRFLSSPSAISYLVLLALVVIWVVRTSRTENFPMPQSLFPWLAATLILTPLTWSWYGTWLLQVQIALVADAFSRERSSAQRFLALAVEPMFLMHPLFAMTGMALPAAATYGRALEAVKKTG
ncbi:MAG: hypothetical protein QGH20_04105 [Candidatus Latescibacteria bacterium]|nr:hypothetical protein [Candidatus Latescibacterota bacterium]